MTDDDTTAIATRLALSSGVSDIIFLLEPELAAFNRTVAAGAAGAATLETLIRLGEELNAFNANAAPIAALPLTLQSSDATVGQPDWDRPEHVGSRVEPGTTALTPSGTRVPRDQAATPLTHRQPHFAGQPVPLRVSRPAAVMMSHAAPPTTKPVAAADAPDTPIAPAATYPIQVSASRSQSIVPMEITSRAPKTIQSRSPDVRAPPVTTAPADTTVEAEIPAQQRKQQVLIGAVAPSRVTNLPPQPGLTSSFAPSDEITSDVPRPRFLTASADVHPGESQPVPRPAEPPQAETEQRRGMMVLDGIVLGRWVIDHLEKSASRPGAMTTGIDPRISATYPGAPTGA